MNRDAGLAQTRSEEQRFYGNLGRDRLIGPWVAVRDLSALKDIATVVFAPSGVSPTRGVIISIRPIRGKFNSDSSCCGNGAHALLA